MTCTSYRYGFFQRQLDNSCQLHIPRTCRRTAFHDLLLMVTAVHGSAWRGLRVSSIRDIMPSSLSATKSPSFFFSYIKCFGGMKISQPVDLPGGCLRIQKYEAVVCEIFVFYPFSFIIYYYLHVCVLQDIVLICAWEPTAECAGC